MTSILPSFVIALALANAAPAAGSAAGRAVLAVPFVPQTEALCGGAAVAMVLRYWGEPHTGVQEFAALVDRRAHGIRTDALVLAVTRRNWTVHEQAGSVEWLRVQVAAGHPVVILIEERPGRYHYVVVVGAAGDRVVVHDPTWGPSRPLNAAALRERWARAGFWSMVILPDVSGVRLQRDLSGAAAKQVRLKADQQVRLKPDTTNECSDLLNRAIDRVQQEGLDVADALFEQVRARCPGTAGPLRELAGVRFAQHRWREAAALGEEAVAIDPRDEYAWDVLGSSRFLQDDIIGALGAWNRIGKPRIDSVSIDGLARTRYALVADALKLPTGTLLTADRFQRAERRLQELPDASGARLGYRPQADGFAGVDVALVESAQPRSAREWIARGVRAAVDRELTASLPGPNGEGGVWSASWRWWTNRPRVAIAFAAPRFGILPGVWRVDASWERQLYRTASGDATISEEHARGGLAVSDWLTANVRYELGAGVDSWNGVRHAASVGGSIERRAFADGVSTTLTAATWMPLDNSRGFQSAALRVGFRSSSQPDRTMVIAESGVEAVSDAAPFNVWPGAGEGQARRPLLRAHPLLASGIVAGPAFGRRLAHASTEAQRWFDVRPVRVAAAAFVDAARVSGRAPMAAGDPFQVDAGIGVRIKAPGQKGALRIDFGRGLRDGSNAFTIGWQRQP